MVGLPNYRHCQLYPNCAKLRRRPPTHHAHSYPCYNLIQYNPMVSRMFYQDLDLLADLVPQYLHRGRFELTAGGSVTWYIDGRELLLNSNGIKIAGRVLNHILLPEAEVIAGPATAGIFVVSATLQETERKLLGCYVRDERKGHGLERRISGSNVSGRKVAIVDDTCSTGHSLLRCAETVQQHGGSVIQVIALFDRDDGGQAVKEAGYRYDYALRVSEDGSCQPQPQ